MDNNSSKIICQYNPRFYPTMGGGEVYVANIVQAFPDYRFEIITNALDNYDLDEPFSENTRILRFTPYDHNVVPFKNKKLSKISFPYRVLSGVIREKKKHAYLKKSMFPLLHVHGIGLEGNFLRVDMWLHRQFFTNMLNFNFVETPKLLTIHNLVSPFTNNPVAKKFEHYLIDQFDNIITVDKNIYLYVKNYAEDKNIWLIPNSIDTNKFKFNVPSEETDVLKIGFVGRLEYSRGLEYLQKLIQNLPEKIEMHVVGAGNENYLNNFKANIGMSKINFHTNMANEDVVHFLNSIDVLFNPVIAEGISRISLEAMSCRKAVIMLDKGDRYPIIHNNTGYLFRNHDELIVLLQHLQSNRSELKMIGKNARKIVENEFDNTVIMPKIKNIYDDLIDDYEY